MAIINAKRVEADEEAERQARAEAEQYAQRHDSLWHQPPPAYEEASTAAGSSSSPGPSSTSANARGENAADDEEEQSSEYEEPVRRSSRRARRPQPNRPRSDRSYGSRSSGRPPREGEVVDDSTRAQQHPAEGEEYDSDDETLPLVLTRRQRYLLRKKLEFNHKYRRACRFVTSFLLLAIIAIFASSWWWWKRPESRVRKPDPWDADGRPIQDPVWSKPVESPPDTWISPSIPTYTSDAWFSFPADLATLFIRAHGSSYTGVVSTNVKDKWISDEKWKQIHDGHVMDRIAVQVHSRFTHQFLRDLVRLNKMRQTAKNDSVLAEGLALYAGSLPTTGTSFVSFAIDIYLPTPKIRTPAGLARDNSSWLSRLEVVADNMRITHEVNYDPKDPTASVATFGQLHFESVNGGVTLATPILANDSVKIVVGNGQIRDLTVLAPYPATIAAPRIDLSTVSGPIWLSGVVARDSLRMRTSAGGMNSTIAVARTIAASNANGLVGGAYVVQDSLDVTTKMGEIMLDVSLSEDLYVKMLKTSGLVALMGPDALPRRIRHRLRTPWRTCTVNMLNEAGGTLVRYLDHAHDTQLDSSIRASTGSVQVAHDAGFEGAFEIRTAIGTIGIDEPHGDPVVLGAPPRKVFVIDREERWRVGDKIVKGRLWNVDHRWQDGGSGRRATFPVSTSLMKTDVGQLLVAFA